MPLRRKDLDPYIPWETLRDAYSSRFGELLEAYAEHDWVYDKKDEPDEEEEERLAETGANPSSSEEENEDEGRAALWELIARCRAAQEAADLRRWPRVPVAYNGLWFRQSNGGETRQVIATFGAAPYSGGHELFISSLLFLGNFSLLLSDLVEGHAPLEPGMVLPVKPDTRRSLAFTAALILPVGIGSFSLGMVGGVERFALQVVPLTPWEKKLADDSIEKVALALERAGVLWATDPLRDCVVSPEGTQEYWAFERPKLIERTKRKLRKEMVHREKLVRIQAPSFCLDEQEKNIAACRAFIAFLEARKVDPELEAEKLAAECRAIEEVLTRVFEETEIAARMTPRELGDICPEIFSLAMSTHPHADLLLQAAIGNTVPLRFDLDAFLASMVDWFRDHHSDANPTTVLEAGRAGFAAAKEESFATDGVVAPHVAWTFVVRSIYATLHDTSTERGADYAVSVTRGIEAVSEALARDDTGEPPYRRLVAAANATIVAMAFNWHLEPRAREYFLAQKKKREKYH
jgi:hypothetical protein